MPHKYFNTKAFKTTILNIWKTKHCIELMELGKNLFTFRFLTESDMNMKSQQSLSRPTTKRYNGPKEQAANNHIQNDYNDLMENMETSIQGICVILATEPEIEHGALLVEDQTEPQSARPTQSNIASIPFTTCRKIRKLFRYEKFWLKDNNCIDLVFQAWTHTNEDYAGKIEATKAAFKTISNPYKALASR
ncbi:hypothetical protein VNO77_20417 [Canavalia gladiata]|uniref:Uncharacterized protein n=1 Tax=Canavalia gladiata TaxID=3824 RepID=A0AAN9LP67_CANGL